MKILTTLMLCALTLVLQGQTMAEIDTQLREAYGQNKYADILKISEKAMKSDSLSMEGFIFRAMALQAVKKYPESLTAIDEGLVRYPNNSHLLTTKGVMLTEYSQPQEAVKWHSLAINYADSDSVRMSCLINRSAAYLSYRKFDEAYDDLLEAYHIDSFNIAVCINLGVVADEVGKADQVLRYYYRVLEIDSTYIDIYNNIGFKLQLDGDHKGAIACFDRLIAYSEEQGGADAFAYSNRSYSKLQIGDLKGAMSDIETSIKLYPLNSWAYRNKGLIYIAMGKNDKACDEFMTALETGFTEMYGDEVMKLYKNYCVK